MQREGLNTCSQRAVLICMFRTCDFFCPLDLGPTPCLCATQVSPQTVAVYLKLCKPLINQCAATSVNRLCPPPPSHPHNHRHTSRILCKPSVSSLLLRRSRKYCIHMIYCTPICNLIYVATAYNFHHQQVVFPESHSAKKQKTRNAHHNYCTSALHHQHLCIMLRQRHICM